MEEEFSRSDVPDSLMMKLFDATGNKTGGNKGFYLFFVNKDGDPNCVSRCIDGTTKIALMSAVSDYAKMINSLDTFGGEDQDD